MTKPVAPINTSSSLPTIATSSSRWNYKTVTIIVGLTVLSFILYKVFSRYKSASTTSTEKNSPPSPSQSLEKGLLFPFMSGLTYQGKTCINERFTLSSERYATAIIRFDLGTFKKSITPGTQFNIQCKNHIGTVFGTCAIDYKGGAFPKSG
jgi:hypothetical protein